MCGSNAACGWMSYFEVCVCHGAAQFPCSFEVLIWWRLIKQQLQQQTAACLNVKLYTKATCLLNSPPGGSSNQLLLMCIIICYHYNTSEKISNCAQSWHNSSTSSNPFPLPNTTTTTELLRVDGSITWQQNQCSSVMVYSRKKNLVAIVDRIWRDSKLSGCAVIAMWRATMYSWTVRWRSTRDLYTHSDLCSSSSSYQGLQQARSQL